MQQSNSPSLGFAKFREKIQAEYPGCIARTAIPRATGGLLSKGHMQNLDSQGLGPKRLKIGKRSGYITSDFLDWLEARSQIIDPSETTVEG
ncbi:MAG: hypothetical protein HY730_02005 [Candidatus Tectomicrobia bacterium]|uniref:AlpA family phage regulatory protein n=1 Tax=Tectimicrobiota bacterium TaxID=2528274 RepID=A0A933GJR0_UNCTE|nr:hypothetical protein [Candidatus Tectomicrobia bacterium]